MQMIKQQIFIWAVALIASACATAASSTSEAQDFTTFSDDPDALFRDGLTGLEIRWNRPPKLTAYDDVVQAEKPCATTELVCIEYPFPLVIPRELKTQGHQKTTEGRLRFYATSGPSISTSVCDVDHFRVVTRLEGTERSYQFDFSRTGGLERVAVLEHDDLGQAVVGEVFNLVAGRVYDHGEVCASGD
jgi:hypothetical protein